MLRLLAALGLTGISWLLGVLGSLLSVHKYEWADEPAMRELTSPDAILAVTVLCVVGLLVALAAFAATPRLGVRRGLRWSLLGAIAFGAILCVRRLLEVLPLYSG